VFFTVPIDYYVTNLYVDLTKAQELY
jgi:hypothetical protein